MQMHSTYRRLIDAAMDTPYCLTGPAAIATYFTQHGLSVSPQKIGNWKSRGVPHKDRRSVCEILGINLLWLAEGTGGKRSDIGQSQSNQTQRPDRLITEIMEKINAMDTIEQAKLLAYLDDRPKAAQAAPSSSQLAKKITGH